MVIIGRVPVTGVTGVEYDDQQEVVNKYGAGRYPVGCALIRSNLHVDADTINSEQEWARLYAEVIWLERWRNRNLAEMIAAMLGGRDVNDARYTTRAKLANRYQLYLRR